MDVLFIFLAIVLPGLLGGLWLGLFVPLATDGRIALVWGNGMLIGLLVIPILMRLLGSLGFPMSFPAISSLAITLTVVAGLAHIYRNRGAAAARSPQSNFSTLSPEHKILFVFLGLLLVVRITTLGLELLWRPLFPWDATMHWATKARVWFEYGSIVPFVDNYQWLKLGGEGVFTDHHPNYPITTPLLQVWMNLAAGSWNESLMNLPWLLCLGGLGAAFYGQLRACGTGTIASIVFTYMLLSMPLINTHVALAGYADLFLGACYCAAIMAFHNWSMTKQPWQAVLALFFAVSCTLIKNEGFYWLLTFIPALVVVLMPRRKAVILLSVLLLAVVGLLMLFPEDLEIAGHSLKRLHLYYRPEALAGIARLLWVHDNWHLFGYLLIWVLPLGLIRSRTTTSTCTGIATALASAVGLFLVLFLFTGYAAGAVRFTAAGRIGLQLVPGLLYLVAILCSEFLAQDQIKASRIPAAPGAVSDSPVASEV